MDKKSQTINLEDLVQDKDEINFLYKLKSQIMMSLLNKHQVKIPGLGTVELYEVRAGNRFKSDIKRFKLHVKMDDNLRIKLENTKQ